MLTHFHDSLIRHHEVGQRIGGFKLLCTFTGLGKVCSTQGISKEYFFAIQILHIDVIGQSAYQHGLKVLGGSIKEFLRDALLWLVVRVDGYVMTIGVLVPLIQSRYNSVPLCYLPYH